MFAAEILFILSSLAFAVSARGLLSALVEGRSFATAGVYSRQARRLGRGYKIMAWGFLTAFLFANLVAAFIETFLAL